MAIIGRVFLMALCVLTAYALPSLTGNNVENKHFSLRSFGSQFQKAAAAVVNPPAVKNSSQDSCITKYSKEISRIHNQTVNGSKECYKSAANAFKEFDRQVLNMTVSEVNALSKNLQVRLANCSAKKTNVEILVCYLDTFDDNLANLNNITSQALVVESSINDYDYGVEVATKMCVNKVVISSKINSSIATNDMQTCLSNTTVGGLYGPRTGLKTLTLN